VKASTSNSLFAESAEEAMKERGKGYRSKSAVRPQSVSRRRFKRRYIISLLLGLLFLSVARNTEANPALKLVAYTNPLSVNKLHDPQLTFSEEQMEMQPVPEPSTLGMMGSGLLAVAFCLRKRRMNH
jgi:hypothetical protein